MVVVFVVFVTPQKSKIHIKKWPYLKPESTFSKAHLFEALQLLVFVSRMMLFWWWCFDRCRFGESRAWPGVPLEDRHPITTESSLESSFLTRGLSLRSWSIPTVTFESVGVVCVWCDVMCKYFCAYDISTYILHIYVYMYIYICIHGMHIEDNRNYSWWQVMSLKSVLLHLFATSQERVKRHIDPVR